MQRDRGTCEECGEECASGAQLRRRLVQLAELARKAGDHDIAAKLMENVRQRDGDGSRGSRRWSAGSGAWDADHRVPVVEGGGECGLEGFRTLCRPCHKRATAALAKRRAEERKRGAQAQAGGRAV